MSDVDIEKLRALLARSTPGYYEVERQDAGVGLFCYDVRAVYTGRDGGTCAVLVGHVSEEDRDGRGLVRAKHDAELWVEMRNAIPALLDRLERAEAQVERLTAAAADADSYDDGGDPFGQPVEHSEAGDR